MATSALHLTYYGISSAVAHALGYKRVSAAWSTNEQADIDTAIDDGCRMFYGAYRWSFLRPQATITTASGMAAYDLPDDFASPRGDFVPPTSSGRAPLVRIGEGRIRQFQAGALQSGLPTHCTIRPKSSTGIAAQKYEVVFYPTPSSAEVISYSYNRVVPYLLRATTLYPFGGAAFSEAIQAACVAKAKEEMEGETAEENVGYLKALAKAIDHDKEMTPDNVGHSAAGDEHESSFSEVTLTVNGVSV